MELQELIERVTQAVGESASPKVTLERAVETMAEALRAGKTVELKGLLRVSLTPKALAPRPPLPEKPAPSESPPPVQVILAVEKANRFSKLTAMQLKSDQRIITVAEGAEAVMQSIKERLPDVLLMESDLEMGDEIRHWCKTDPARSLISLIVLFHEGENPDAIDRFRICEDDFLIEPYEMETLAALVDREAARIRAERKHFRHEISFQFPAEARYHSQAADLMETLVSRSGLSEEGQMGVVVAFREAVDNAIRHGKVPNRKGIITVAYVVDHEKITVTVEDEGPGFDSSIYLETRVSGDAIKVARARHREGRQGGLGIMLMLKSVDRLEYNREGNMVKLTKFLPKR